MNEQTLQSMKVSRDGEGELIPVERDTKYGPILVLPMVYGDAEAWGKESRGRKEIPAELLAKKFAKHVVDPNMSGITGEELRKEFKPLAIQELIMAIMGASGLEDEVNVAVNEDGGATLDFLGG